MNASTLLLTALLERGDYLERLTQEQTRELLGILETAHDEVLGKIAKTGGEWTREWLADVAADIDSIYAAAVKKAYGAASSDLKALAANETVWLEGELGKVAAGVSITAPSAGALWASIAALPAASGSTLAQLFDALGVNSRHAVVDAIRLGMAEGETVDQLTRRLRGTVIKRASWRKVDGKRTYIPGQYEGGAIENITTRQAQALARTAVMHVGNQAREALYQENADIIKGYQRVETLDGDTCLVCGADDGHVYTPDEARPALPEHPNCRGLYVPVLKSFRELGLDVDEFPASTRASMDGQVAESETYTDRLAKMDAATRRSVLGPGRADLYERGVSLKDMVSNGKLVPLKDIRSSRGLTAIKPKREAFVPARTTREAEQWAKEHNIANVVHYGKLPVSIANEMNKSLWEAYEGFPELREGMQVLGSNQAIRKWYINKRTAELVPELKKINQNSGYSDKAIIDAARKHAGREFRKTPANNWAMAYSGREISGITFNEIAAKNEVILSRSLKISVERGFHPVGCDTVRSIIDHEIGHRIDAMLGWVSPRTSAVVGEMEKAAGLDGMSMRERYTAIRTGLSQYGTENPRETLAEAWAEYLNNPTPRPIAKGIGDWVRRKYAEWKELNK